MGEWISTFDGLRMLAGIVCIIVTYLMAQCGFAVNALDTKKRAVLLDKGIEGTCRLSDAEKVYRNDEETYYWVCSLEWDIYTRDGKELHLRASRNKFIIRSDIATTIPRKGEGLGGSDFKYHKVLYVPESPNIYILKEELEKYEFKRDMRGNCWKGALLAFQVLFFILGVLIGLSGGLITGVATLFTATCIILIIRWLSRRFFSKYEWDHDIEDTMLEIADIPPDYS